MVVRGKCMHSTVVSGNLSASILHYHGCKKEKRQKYEYKRGEAMRVFTVPFYYGGDVKLCSMAAKSHRRLQSHTASRTLLVKELIDFEENVFIAA